MVMSAERWLDEYGGGMYRYALTRLGQSHAAEDAVQETLLAAAAAEPCERSRAQERAWLYAILHNKTVDHVRREVRQRRAEADAATLAAIGATTCGCHAEGVEPQMDGIAEAELRQALQKAIEHLPDLMREAFCFRVIDGLSTDDICKILEISPTNLWTLIHRAKRRLHVSLGERFSDSSGGSQL